MNFYNEIHERLYQSLLLIFPIIYFLMSFGVYSIGQQTEHTLLTNILFFSKLSISIILLVCFFISLFWEKFKKEYIIYPIYLLLFLLNINNVMRIFADPDKPVHLLVIGCTLILNTYAFSSFKPLVFYSIFSSFLIFFVFKNAYEYTYINSIICTSVIMGFFIFVFVFLNIKIKVNKKIEELIKRQKISINLEKKYAKELSHLNLIHTSIFQSAPLQMALLDGKTFRYKIVNEKAFPPELKNWIIDKDDDQYAKYINISPRVSHDRIKKLLECRLSKQSVTFQEKIKFINKQERIYRRIYTPVINKDKVSDILMLGEDVTDDVFAKNKLEHQLKIDSLTGIYNRMFIEDKITENIKNKKYFSILFVDIDNFKKINDDMGHDQGDKVLKLVSEYLKDNIQQNKDYVGRLGGDEFIIFFEGLYNKDNILKKINKLYKGFKNSVTRYFTDYNITLSMGVSVYPFDSVTKSEILKKADKAMYYSKKICNKDHFTLYKDIENETF